MKHKRKKSGLFSDHLDQNKSGTAINDLERSLKYKSKSSARKGCKCSRKNPVSKILDTNGSADFIKGRKYDTDMDRLMRRDVQNEMQKGTNQLNKEMRKSMKEFKRDIGKY